MRAKERLLQKMEEEMTAKDIKLKETEEETRVKDIKLKEKEVEASTRDRLLKEKEEEVSTKDRMLKEKEEELRLNDGMLKEKEEEMRVKDRMLKGKEEEAKLKDEEWRQKLLKLEEGMEKMREGMKILGDEKLMVEMEWKKREVELGDCRECRLLRKEIEKLKEEEQRRKDRSLSCDPHTLFIRTSLMNDAIRNSNPTTFQPGSVQFVDGKLELLFTDLVNTTVFLTSPDCYKKIIELLTSHVEKIFSRTQLVFWMKQVCHFVITFITSCPEENLDDRQMRTSGIPPLVPPGQRPEKPQTIPQKFISDLLTLLLTIYNKILEITYKCLDKNLINTVYHIFQEDQQVHASKNLSSSLPDKDNRKNMNNLVLVELTKMKKKLETWEIFDSIVVQFFNQVYQYIDFTLWNELLAKPWQYCTMERGFHIKYSVSQLQDWKFEYNMKKHLQSGQSLQSVCNLNYMTEASNLMVLDKTLFTDKAVVNELFPTLSLNSIFYLLTNFQSSKMLPGAVPRSILEEFKKWGARSDIPPQRATSDT
eukprot:TRINITY_DN9791_c0_g1_i10.p1 TRINITY_DN9791_c0_g1~~TRINITY_DN9791_c0_g1_i10.p1  ORF type:complete len:535 (-),score=167.90 TRINITY_DN9791_c0_g1_i10:270-1874(-)